MRINLIPPAERASLKVIQPITLLLIAGTLFVSTLAFSTVYLRWQVANERSRLASYQSTIAAVGRYRQELSRLEMETEQLSTLSKPLQVQLAANQLQLDLVALLSQSASSAAASNVWLRELVVQGDGITPLTGYAVDSGDVSGFLGTLGQGPFAVLSSSTRRVEQGGARLLEFSARVGVLKGGARP